MPPAAPSPTSKVRLADRWRRLAAIYHREIWQSASLKEDSLRGVCYAVLRVISITATAFNESRIVSRAAALSFSSLLGLGPLIALAVLVAGFALGSDEPLPEPPPVSEERTVTAARNEAERPLTKNELRIADALSRMIKVVAPQIEQFEQITQTTSDEMVNPELVKIIGNIITASRSGTAGALGGFTLIVIVLLLFKSIEDTFNDIWGVRQGRSVFMRIMFYWTVLTLGAVVFFAAVALLSAGTFANVFMEWLPGGEMLIGLLSWLPLVSFVLITSLLTLFYRVIPNTRVFWRPAFIGGLVVAGLLTLNSFGGSLYLKRVYLEKSLYGGLALPLVIMSGLYIFWLCVLTGGIVSYAIQNVHFRNSQAAWGTLSQAMRERVELVVFLTICRRFRECLPPVSASDLSTMLRVPAQFLNECLSRLVRLQLVATLSPPANSTEADFLYQPARPLNRMTLFDFKNLDEALGENPLGTSLERIDPLLARYDAALQQLGEQEFFKRTIDELLDEQPFEESRPPFAMARVKARD